jgi:hypothetical protein
VGHDIQDDAVRIADEEAADAPRLVRERTDDLRARGQRPRMDGVDVFDLDGHVRVDRLGGVVPDDAELRRLVRG